MSFRVKTALTKWETNVSLKPKSFLGTDLLSNSRFKRFPDAEAALTESLELYSTRLQPRSKRQNVQRVLESTVEMCRAWHVAEPKKGYDAKLAECQQRLEVNKTAESRDLEDTPSE